ncbi:DNA-binding XRE family transcriptional regulator [Mobilisporobacter senegalensis]|uniref:DNA-binding XRE family transcriptional regulator n=1 Tax=Mobilisporobacter senegalensis TaxID=1329262 RepID=A0A3N1XG68_9FIRM|nr:helix-turn-helix transcriptional regulator [Mobilisporobacter senegalensis]ROR23992.1 DNA-binding XRE family transcriptional regulator [Mobilisporobacter senegalensis]
MNRLQLAENIIELRHQYKVTQDELAEFLGISKASVSKWENRQNYPDITLLPRLASYFNVSVDQLLGFKAQMTKEKIKECYHELASDFANLPFEEVMTKTNELVKEYYSCYPLLMQIVILWMNHFNMAGSESRQKEILKSIMRLCDRIITESESTGLSSDAVVLKAMVQIQMKETQEAIESLEEILDPKRLTRQSDGLLIQAYQMTGETKKAEKTAQISILTNLLGILGSGVNYLSMHLSDPELAELILKRLEKVVEIFETDRLHPNISLLVFYQATIFYCLQQKIPEALGELKKFTDCSIYMINQGVRLHGDEFFTKLDEWFDELDLGAEPVRNKKLVIADIFKMYENPALSSLFEEEEYKELKKRLQREVCG